MILSSILREISSSASEMESLPLNIYNEEDFCPSLSSSCLLIGDDDSSCLLPEYPELLQATRLTRSWGNYDLILTAALVYAVALITLAIWISCWQNGYFKCWICKNAPAPASNNTEGMTQTMEESADDAYIIHFRIAELINDNTAQSSRFNEKGVN